MCSLISNNLTSLSLYICKVKDLLEYVYSKKIVAEVKNCTFSIAKVVFIAGNVLKKLDG
jgi:hypothetical protein